MFYEFIKTNYKWIIACIYALAVFLILFFKKKIKVVDVVKAIIAEILPQVIIDAENKYGAGNGDEKLTYCITVVCEAIAQKYGIDEMTVFKVYRPYIESQIENILSTPKKK